jgi:hypothetical protein
MPKLHQNVLHGFGKEKDMGVMQTPLLCVQIPIQGGLRKQQVHPRSNVYIQRSHATT